MRWDSYVGIPWLDRGRDATGCDCWGLYRLLMRDGLGVDLPSYDERYAGPGDKAAIEELIEGGRSTWLPVSRDVCRPFDLVLLHGRTWHVGTVVRRGMMLHVQEGRSSVIEPLTAVRFGGRIEGLYRHEALIRREVAA